LKGQEVAISKWIRDSGAAGVVWGDIEAVGDQKYALLQWTGSDLSELERYSFSRVVYKPTVVFPKLPINDLYGFIRIWLIQKAKLHFEGAMGTHEGDIEPNTDEDKKAFREVAVHSCESTPYSVDCRRFANVQIDLFLEDSWNEHLWTSEDDKNQLYSCCYYYNSTGREAIDAFPVIQSPEEMDSRPTSK
jgi:hypothetical protein